MNPCKIISNFFNVPQYGNIKGICRITGELGDGVEFDKWVKDTFTDFDSLHEGNIISNEAIFCFEEKNEQITKFLCKEKPQKLRSYSIIVSNNTLYLLTKADKRKMYCLLVNEDPQIVCLSESGQKHLLFRNKVGFWQLETNNCIPPNKEQLERLMICCQTLLRYGFTQSEIITTAFPLHKLAKLQDNLVEVLEAIDVLSNNKNTPIFDLTMFLIHKQDDDS